MSCRPVDGVKLSFAATWLTRIGKKLSRWLENSESAENFWLPFVCYVTQLENSEKVEESEDAVQQFMKRTRHSVQAVVSCNVLLPDPLNSKDGKDMKSLGAPFDVIITNYCLESASRTIEECFVVVANVVRLLRSSGHVIIRVGIVANIVLVKCLKT